LTAGTRRNGSKVGPFHRAAAPSRRPQSSGRAQPRPVGWPLLGPQHGLRGGLGGGQAALAVPAFGTRPLNYAGRHGVVRDKTARKLTGKAVPAAAVAATLAAGAAAYTLAGAGHPDPAQLNAAIARHEAAPAAGHASASNAAASTAAAGPATVITVTTAAVPSAPAKPQGKHAKPATAKPDTVTAKTTGKHAAPTASTTASASAPSAATLSCGTSYSLLPENTSAIVGFLLAHGYSDNAAAGIAGNIYQESKGDPEAIGSGGGGLIGWTPLPGGYVTGDVSADLETQLSAILTYNGIWSQYISELNAASSPADAAYIYVTDFERAGIPAAATREASAQDVASACGI
jgi:Phage tail lysozyme